MDLGLWIVTGVLVVMVVWAFRTASRRARGVGRYAGHTPSAWSQGGFGGDVGGGGGSCGDGGGGC